MDDSDTTSTDHPHVFVTSESAPGLRSVDDVREAIETGVGRDLWGRLESKLDADLDADPILPTTELPSRSDRHAETGYVDFHVVHEACQRIKRAALAALVTEDPKYRDVALDQIDALFDEERWPIWQDQHHVEKFDLTADLRTGVISRDVAIAYDWLYPQLSPDQRDWIVDGLDRRGIESYFQALEDDAWWADAGNNWMTVIVGGFGVVGMVLGDDHPRSKELVDVSVPRMEAYLDRYGPDGEFNESVGYAAATKLPVLYFMARRYATRGGSDELEGGALRRACRWLMYGTVPPGTYAALGDTHADDPVRTAFFPAVAMAARDETLQWYYTTHLDRPEVRDLPLEILWYDDTLDSTRPDGVLPCGRAFEAHGGLVTSRSSWNPESPASLVYSKAGIEGHHQHHDAGQVCVDAYGRRLIRDLGSPSGYPEDFFDENRWEYYNASSHGHNVFEFGDKEMPVEGGREGRVLDAAFDDEEGGYWQFGLSEMYDLADRVTRTVVHLLPHTVAVIDAADLSEPDSVSMRWHTANEVAPDGDGNFLVEDGPVGLASRVVALDGSDLSFSSHRHEYVEPFDETRAGAPLEQRREPFVEARIDSATSCRLLSLFAVSPPDREAGTWNGEGPWRLDGGDEEIVVSIDGDGVVVTDERRGRSWSVPDP
jgi:hypothetical protein